MGENSTKKRKMMKLASRGKRFGAFCIDAIVPFISLIIFTVTSIMMGFSASGQMGNGFGSDPYSQFGYGYGYGYGYDRASLAGAIVAIVIASIMMVIYLIVQIVFYTKSKTLGKAVLGLQVVSSKSGEPIGFWPMLFREWFVKNASATVFGLGFIWILIDDKNRGWHDKILETYVIDLKESEKLNARSRKRSRPAGPAVQKSGEAVRTSQPLAKYPSEVKSDPAEDKEIKNNVIEVTETIVKTAEETSAKVIQEAHAEPVIEEPSEQPAVIEQPVAAKEQSEPETEETAFTEPEAEITVVAEEPEIKEPEEIKRVGSDEQE